MVVSRDEFMRRLGLPGHWREALVVTPLVSVDKQVADKDSIDLRLGTSFLLTRSDRLAANIPGHAQGAQFQRAVHAPLGRYLVIPGHHTVLASTLEFIKLPDDLSAMVLTRSSWARTFVTIATAPWVHPCYRGCLTLEIANMSETPVVVHPGLCIAQLVLLQAGEEATQDEEEGGQAGGEGEKREESDPLRGSYVGPTYPEPPAFRRPEIELHEQLGLTKEHIEFPWYGLHREDAGIV